ncbi:multicopper oxidase domain-containing protein [Halorussus limi]|uniref:multicopper oxidase domain-containing protein n=1 Tax=Halorussus limi TaxID=2938695 RepID=UPI0034A3D165
MLSIAPSFFLVGVVGRVMVSNNRNVSRRRVLRIGRGAALLGITGSRGVHGLGAESLDGSQEEVGGDGQDATLVAMEGRVEVAPGETSDTWLYDDRYPGPELRVSEGDTLRVSVENRLPEETTVHWHGIPVPNPMDGVPNVTHDPVPPGETFTYEYEASPAGTYVYHSHVGLQFDRALNGPLIVEEESPHVEYDREFTLVVDD